MAKNIFIKADNYSVQRKLDSIFDEDILCIKSIVRKGNKLDVEIRGQDDNQSLLEGKTYSLDGFLDRCGYDWKPAEHPLFWVVIRNYNTKEIVSQYSVERKTLNQMTEYYKGLRTMKLIGNLPYNIYVYRETRKKDNFKCFMSVIYTEKPINQPDEIQKPSKTIYLQ